MARVANALIPVTTSTDALYNPGIQEFMDRSIQMVGQDKTPIISKTRGQNIASTGTPRTQWMTDKIPDAEKTSRPYGDQMTPTIYTREERRESTVETRWQMHSVSEEEERTAKYGYGSLRARIMMKQGIAIRKGMEQTIINDNQGTQYALAGNQYTAKTPTLEALLSTNVEHGTGAANEGGWDAATKTFTARTRAAAANDRVVLSFNDMVQMVDDICKDYSEPELHTNFWMNLDFKAKAADFKADGNAPFRTMLMPGQAGHVTQNIDVITTNAGKTIKLNWSPQMAADNTNVFLVDPEKLTVAYLFRNLPVVTGKKGLSTEFGTATNFGLIFKPEAGAGGLFDRKVA